MVCDAPSAGGLGTPAVVVHPGHNTMKAILEADKGRIDLPR